FRYIGTAPTTRPSRSSKVRCCGAQPARAVAEPLSSSALRKTCDTVGLTSPAQASHAAGATSRIAGCTRSVIVSSALPAGFLMSLMYLARSADLGNGFNLDRDAGRQRADADCGARVAADIAKYLDHQIGGAVD